MSLFRELAEDGLLSRPLDARVVIVKATGAARYGELGGDVKGSTSGDLLKLTSLSGGPDFQRVNFGRVAIRLESVSEQIGRAHV